jgi:hypothetical protein
MLKAKHEQMCKYANLVVRGFDVPINMLIFKFFNTVTAFCNFAGQILISRYAGISEGAQRTAASCGGAY